MRGEELKSLNVQQLQALEKSLESGLGSVLKTKVRVLSVGWSDVLGEFAHLTISILQSKKIMDEISELERKVSAPISPEPEYFVLELKRNSSWNVQDSIFVSLTCDSSTCVLEQRVQLIEENSRLKEQVSPCKNIPSSACYLHICAFCFDWVTI